VTGQQAVGRNAVDGKLVLRTTGTVHLEAAFDFSPGDRRCRQCSRLETAPFGSRSISSTVTSCTTVVLRESISGVVSAVISTVGWIARIALGENICGVTAGQQNYSYQSSHHVV
jgi:hypothetical protein